MLPRLLTTRTLEGGTKCLVQGRNTVAIVLNTGQKSKMAHGRASDSEEEQLSQSDLKAFFYSTARS